MAAIRPYAVQVPHGADDDGLASLGLVLACVRAPCPESGPSPPKNRNILLVCGIGDANLCHSERSNYMRGTLPVSSIGGGASGGSSGFGRLAAKTSQLAGKGTTFLLATAVVVLWAATGPLFHYSDTWQLVINTGTTIVTFLMVFLIQNSQNRDSLALQLKLDELILATKGARNSMACIEDASEDQLDEAKENLRKRAPRPGLVPPDKAG